MYQNSVKGEEKTQVVKADRLLQRLLTAAHAGRSIELTSIMKHELYPVPLALAKVGGTINTTAKPELMNILLSDRSIEVPEIIQGSNLPTCAVVDNHTLIQDMGKPADCVTFGDYADMLLKTTLKNFDQDTNRVDVV